MVDSKLTRIIPQTSSNLAKCLIICRKTPRLLYIYVQFEKMRRTWPHNTPISYYTQQMFDLAIYHKKAWKKHSSNPHEEIMDSMSVSSKFCLPVPTVLSSKIFCYSSNGLPFPIFQRQILILRAERRTSL